MLLTRAGRLNTSLVKFSFIFNVTKPTYAKNVRAYFFNGFFINNVFGTKVSQPGAYAAHGLEQLELL